MLANFPKMAAEYKTAESLFFITRSLRFKWTCPNDALISQTFENDIETLSGLQRL